MQERQQANGGSDLTCRGLLVGHTEQRQCRISDLTCRDSLVGHGGQCECEGSDLTYRAISGSHQSLVAGKGSSGMRDASRQTPCELLRVLCTTPATMINEWNDSQQHTSNSLWAVSCSV